MDPDVGGQPPGLLPVPLPRMEVPAPAGGDVGEEDVTLPLPGLRGVPLLQRLHRGVEPELQDGVDLPPRLGLQLLQGVQVPRVDDEGLLADGVRAEAEGEADVCVVQIVRGTDREIMHPVFLAALPKFFDVAIEPLEFPEVADILEVAVEDSHRVVGVGSDDEAVARVPDRPKVAGRDVPGHAGDREIFHGFPVPFWFSSNSSAGTSRKNFAGTPA